MSRQFLRRPREINNDLNQQIAVQISDQLPKLTNQPKIPFFFHSHFSSQMNRLYFGQNIETEKGNVLTPRHRSPEKP